MYRERLVATEVQSENAHRLKRLLLEYHDFRQLKAASPLLDDTRRIAQHRKTLFSIGFVPSVFYGQLPLMVRRLRQNKNLEIVLHELKTREQVEALKAGKIDIGFGRLHIQDPDVDQELLFDEPMVAAVPANHPLTRHPPLESRQQFTGGDRIEAEAFGGGDAAHQQ